MLAVGRLRSSRAAPISIPARVTRRAKRSGRITVSAAPLDCGSRRSASAIGAGGDRLGDVELARRGGRAAARGARRPRRRARAASSTRRVLAPGRAPRRSSWRAEAYSVSKTEPLPALDRRLVALRDRAVLGRSRARPARRSARAGRSVAVPLDLAHLPVGARGVVAAVEVLGRGEVVLGLGRVGDLALGSARGGRRGPRRVRASGRSNRTGRRGRRGGTGRPCGRRPRRAASCSS